MRMEKFRVEALSPHGIAEFPDSWTDSGQKQQYKLSKHRESPYVKLTKTICTVSAR